MSKKPWTEVEVDLVENVFYAHDEARVRKSADLAKEGMLDSLSIVAILEILAEAGGDEDALDSAQATDFRNFSRIQALYDRL